MCHHVTDLGHCHTAGKLYVINQQVVDSEGSQMFIDEDLKLEAL